MPICILIYERCMDMRGYGHPDCKVSRLFLNTDVVFEDSIECDIKCCPGQQRAGCQLPVTTMPSKLISLGYAMASIGYLLKPS
jgi:hypothetical protein